MVAWAGSMVAAQKVTTADDLDKAMKKVGPALQATNKALASGATDEAVKQIAIMKQAIVDSREFWVVNKKDDALEANKLTVEKIEAVEKMLAGGAANAQAAQASLKQDVGGACRQCHEKYRVRDADNNWVLKPGSIGG